MAQSPHMLLVTEAFESVSKGDFHCRGFFEQFINEKSVENRSYHVDELITFFEVLSYIILFIIIHFEDLVLQPALVETGHDWRRIDYMGYAVLQKHRERLGRTDATCIQTCPASALLVLQMRCFRTDTGGIHFHKKSDF